MINKEEIFEYLNLVKDSGITNMFGAGVYIEDEFGVSHNEARDLLVE